MKIMNVDNIFKSICNLNIVELADLITKFKSKFKLDFNKPTDSLTVVNNMDTIEGNLVLIKLPSNKLPVIKLLKNLLNCTLMQAKQFTDTVPSKLLINVVYDKAKNIKSQLESIGCVLDFVK